MLKTAPVADRYIPSIPLPPPHRYRHRRPPPSPPMLCSLLRRALTLTRPPTRQASSLHLPSRMPAPMPPSTFSSSASPAAARRPLRGVVFDMDGTLTVPVIDFPAMYRAVLGEDAYTRLRSQNPHGCIDILHHIETWGPAEKLRAYEAIAHFEKLGMDRLQIMPGAAELCEFLDSRTIRRGLITRNVQDAVQLFHHRFGIEFRPALSREFRPYKPDPAPLLHICATWDINPSEVMMVGDSLRDDVVCGKRAGAITCLLDETGRYGSPELLTDDLAPDYTVSSLTEVYSLLENHFELTSQQCHGIVEL